MDRTPVRRTRPEGPREPDGIRDDVCVEVKVGAHSIRNLRDGLLQLAHYLVERPGMRGLLVLVDSRISGDRLDREVQSARRVLHPDLVGRLTVAVSRQGTYSALPEDLTPDFRQWLDGLVRKEKSRGRIPRETPFEILQVLVHQWLLGRGPMTSDSLAKTVGCSYPTVAHALRRFEHHIVRTSDRRVELRHFPADAWRGLLAVTDDVRHTMRFADRSGQPRGPEALLDRLRRLRRTDIGVGGVIGARHYDPGLDLVGASRLDLTWHRRSGRGTPDFVAKLDPALQPAPAHGHPVHLVVHVLRRADSLFQAGDAGLPWADPAECLLDLNEARLVHQADEFIVHLRRKQVETR